MSETPSANGFNRLGKDTILYGLSILLVRGLQIFLIPIYSRVLEPGAYGIVETIAIAGALVNLTVALEISQGMARYIAEASDTIARQTIASTALGFSCLAYLSFAVLVAAFATPLSSWLFGELVSNTMLVLAASAIAVNGTFVILQDMLRWQLRPGTFVLASLGYAIGSAFTGIWLVAFEGIGVAGVFWGQLAGATLGAMVAFLRAGDLLGFVFDGNRLRQMLRYSLPLVLSGFAVFGNLFIDRLVVRDLLGIPALGVYGVAARFASVVSILAVGLQAALSPLIFRHWREPGTDAFLGRVSRIYCFAMVPLVGGISLFAHEILGVLTGAEFQAGSQVLPLLTLGAMFSTLYVFAPGLFLGKRTGQVALLNTIGAAFNLVIALLLTNKVGMIGAAATAALTPAIIFTGYVGFGRKWFKVNYQKERIIVSLVIVILFVAAGSFGPMLFTYTVITNIVIKSVVLLSGTCLVFFGGLDQHDRDWIFQSIAARNKYEKFG